MTLMLHNMIMEVKKIFAYRWEFWFNFVGHTAIAIYISYALWKYIFELQSVNEMQGYTLNELIVYYVMANLLAKGILGANIDFISRDIYQGHLNRYILYPISFFSFKLSQYLAHSFFYFLQLFILFFIAALSLDSIQLTPIFPVLIIFTMGATCYFYISACIEMLAFWFDNTWSLMIMLRFFFTFIGGIMIPLPFFPEWAQDIIMLTPFPHIIFIPANFLLHGVVATEFYYGITIIALWTIFFKIVANFIWNQGKYKYSGVGI